MEISNKCKKILDINIIYNNHALSLKFLIYHDLTIFINYQPFYLENMLKLIILTFFPFKIIFLAFLFLSFFILIYYMIILLHKFMMLVEVLLV